MKHPEQANSQRKKIDYRLPRAWGRGTWKVLLYQQRVSVWGDENFQKQTAVMVTKHCKHVTELYIFKWLKQKFLTYVQPPKKTGKKKRTKGDRKGRREEGALVNEPKPIKQDRMKPVKRLAQFSKEGSW